MQDESSQGGNEDDGSFTGEEHDSEDDNRYNTTSKLRRSTATSVTTRNYRRRSSDPTVDGHPLKPWVNSLRKSSGSAGERHESPRNATAGVKIRGEPLGAMRARWSSVPSRVREDVRKDRQKWLDQQARGKHMDTMPHEIVKGRDDSALVLPPGESDSEAVDTTGAGGKWDTLTFQADKEEWLGFDDAIVNQQCHPQTRRGIVKQLADDRLSRYFADTEPTRSPLDRHLGAQASSYYKPRTQAEGASATTADADEMQSSPGSQECVS